MKKGLLLLLTLGLMLTFNNTVVAQDGEENAQTTQVEGESEDGGEAADAGPGMTPGPDGAGASRREALSRALVEEGDRLYALALRTTRDPDLAADAVQEAFASALEKADGFRGESRVGTWLHRIVFNKSIDLLRQGRAW